MSDILSPSANRLPQCSALMEKDTSCFAENALVLINDGNLSADSHSAFQPGSG